MRNGLCLVVWTLAGACAPQANIEMSHMSTMNARTQGVVLYGNGQSGHGAMNGTTCAFDTLNGWLMEDDDLPTDTEQVMDVREGTVLGISTQGAHLVQHRQQDVWTTGIVNAKLFRGGVAMLRRGEAGCEVAWSDGGSTLVPASACDDATRSTVSADPRDGSVYIGSGEETIVVTEDGVFPFDDAADYVVYDRRTKLVYLAMEGYPEVRAVDRNGEQVWTAALDGGVHALKDMGRRAKLVVMVASSSGGDLVVLDGFTGEEVSRSSTPDYDVELSVSDDGTTLGVTLPEAVLFFDVYEEGESPKLRQSLGADPDAPVFSD